MYRFLSSMKNACTMCTVSFVIFIHVDALAQEADQNQVLLSKSDNLGVNLDSKDNKATFKISDDGNPGFGASFILNAPLNIEGKRQFSGSLLLDYNTLYSFITKSDVESKVADKDGVENEALGDGKNRKKEADRFGFYLTNYRSVQYGVVFDGSLSLDNGIRFDGENLITSEKELLISSHEASIRIDARHTRSWNEKTSFSVMRLGVYRSGTRDSKMLTECMPFDSKEECKVTAAYNDIRNSYGLTAIGGTAFIWNSGMDDAKSGIGFDLRVSGKVDLSDIGKHNAYIWPAFVYIPAGKDISATTGIVAKINWNIGSGWGEEETGLSVVPTVFAGVSY